MILAQPSVIESQYAMTGYCTVYRKAASYYNGVIAADIWQRRRLASQPSTQRISVAMAAWQ